ncbi:MAG: SPASM domain-containing protein [Armatimonadetes bacterium]|nr:SPASM domain-containing protein [Armatimonadota bacterium]
MTGRATGSRAASCPDAPAAGVRLGNTLAHRLLPPVVYADIFLTEDCNHQCDYCFVKGKQPRTISREVASAAIEFMIRSSARQHYVRFLFFGGEPLLEWGLLQGFVEYASSRARQSGRRAEFSITTNGSLLDEKRCTYLREIGVKYLLSIDGDKGSHDRHRHMRSGQSSYDEVMERLPMMKRYQPWQGTRMTLTPYTAARACQNVRHLYSRGINQFIIGPATGIAWPDDALATYEAQMVEIAELYRELKAKKAPFRMTLFEKDCEADAGKYKGVWGCGAGRGRVCISVTGDLYGCAKILGVDGLKDTHKLGDVWNGITNLKGRLDLLSVKPEDRPQCASCQHSDDCGGGCPATNYEATGSLFQPAPLDCALMPIVKRVRATLKDEPDGK